MDSSLPAWQVPKQSEDPRLPPFSTSGPKFHNKAVDRRCPHCYFCHLSNMHLPLFLRWGETSTGSHVQKTISAPLWVPRALPGHIPVQLSSITTLQSSLIDTPLRAARTTCIFSHSCYFLSPDCPAIACSLENICAHLQTQLHSALVCEASPCKQVAILFSCLASCPAKHLRYQLHADAHVLLARTLQCHLSCPPLWCVFAGHLVDARSIYVHQCWLSITDHGRSRLDPLALFVVIF